MRAKKKDLEDIPSEIVDYWYDHINKMNIQRMKFIALVHSGKYELHFYRSKFTSLIIVNFGDGFVPIDHLCQIDNKTSTKLYRFEDNWYNEKDMLKILKMKAIW